MEENSITKFIQNCFEEEDKNIEDEDALIKKRNEMIKELEKIRIKNRKLLFGLWLYKFIKNYSEKEQKKHIDIQSEDIKDSIGHKIMEYGLAFAILVLIIFVLMIKIFINERSIT